MLFCVDKNGERSMWPVQTGWSDEEAAEAALEYGRCAHYWSELATEYSSSKPVTTNTGGPFSLKEEAAGRLGLQPDELAALIRAARDVMEVKS